MKYNSKTYKLTDIGKFGQYSLITGILFLLLSGIGYFQDSTHFFLAYLTSFVFWISISLGGLFFTMLHHITGAKWSIVIRRISECVTGTLPLMAVLFIPLAFGMHELYHWSHADIVATDELLQEKSPYLNTAFFLIRTAGYFVIWILLSQSLIKTSLKQDNGHKESQLKKMRRVSAPGMVLFALTITFSSFDWLMSLDAHWFSTIFGVYIFSGAFLAILSFLVLIMAYQRKNNVLSDIITVEHYHDLGKFIFAFIIFWAYMAFSQYFLIWYSNLPEENYWFLYRWDNSWEAVSMIIIFGHFVIPFVILLTRASKRNIRFLAFMAGWILVMRWIDLYWLVMPTHYRDGLHFSWLDITTFIGIGGLFLWFFWRRYTTNALVPVNDPGLTTSIKFINN